MKLKKVIINITNDEPSIAISKNICMHINKYSDINYLLENQFEKELELELDLIEHLKRIDEIDEIPFFNEEKINRMLNKVKEDKNIKIKEAILYIENSNINKEELQEIFDNLPKRTIINFEQSTDDEIKNILINYNIREDILIKYKYNQSNPVKKEDVLETIKMIEDTSNEIKKYNLSPLEQTIFLYDLLRNRKYKESKDINNIALSRDLTNILKSDEIVCLGFSNLYASILNKLGIVTEIQEYYREESKYGHASNLVYINDNKYDVHQVFETDVTWGSKKNDTNDYLNNYNTLLLNTEMAYKIKNNLGLLTSHKWNSGLLKTIERVKENNIYNSNSILEISEITIIYKRIKEISDKIGLYELSKKCDFNIKLCNIIFDKIKDKSISKKQLSDTNDQIRQNLNRILQNFNMTVSNTSQARIMRAIFEVENNPYISKEIFIKSIYNVRRIEHMIDPKKYELSIDKIYEIAKNRYSDIKYEEVIEILLEVDLYNDNNSKEKIETDIKRIEMLSSLKNYQKKINK